MKRLKGRKFIYYSNGLVHSMIEDGDIYEYTGEFIGQDEALILVGKNAGMKVGILMNTGHQEIKYIGDKEK